MKPKPNPIEEAAKVEAAKEAAKQKEDSLLERYKTKIEIVVDELETKLKDHQKNPKTHPMYVAEWKLFWSRKYKELLEQDKDANIYDYKPEWIKFWTVRMEELHGLDIAKKKEELGQTLGLSLETINNFESALIFQKEIDSKSTPSKLETLTDSKLQPRPSIDHLMDFTVSPETMKGPINIISVCRLLTALEPELGLFAQCIFNLLEKAVTFEKVKPNSADELLLSIGNCNILEIVKEKFKGVLVAKLISPKRLVAVRCAVENIEKLLQNPDLKKPQMPTSDLQSLFTNMNVEETTVVSDDLDDEKILHIAMVISEILMKEGRTDISQEELESLVEIFMNAENDNNIMQVVLEETVETKATDTNIKMKPAMTKVSNILENLSDEDLQTLLRNYVELSSEEKKCLKEFLLIVEETNPTRATELRKYINMDLEENMDLN